MPVINGTEYVQVRKKRAPSKSPLIKAKDKFLREGYSMSEAWDAAYKAVGEKKPAGAKPRKKRATKRK